MSKSWNCVGTDIDERERSVLLNYKKKITFFIKMRVKSKMKKKEGGSGGGAMGGGVEITLLQCFFA